MASHILRYKDLTKLHESIQELVQKQQTFKNNIDVKKSREFFYRCFTKSNMIYQDGYWVSASNEYNNGGSQINDDQLTEDSTNVMDEDVCTANTLQSATEYYSLHCNRPLSTDQSESFYPKQG